MALRNDADRDDDNRGHCGNPHHVHAGSGAGAGATQPGPGGHDNGNGIAETLRDNGGAAGGATDATPAQAAAVAAAGIFGERSPTTKTAHVVGGGDSSSPVAVLASARLPFTGITLWPLVLLGLACSALGIGMTRVRRSATPAAATEADAHATH